MYTNYSSLSCRSRSTTDLFKARSLDDPTRPVVSYNGATSSIVNSSLQNGRNRRRRAAPAPPKRTDSFNSVFVPSALKRTRTEEPSRRRLIETSTPVHEAMGTPRSNFLKKLITSLEHRQKEISVANELADNEFVIKKNVRRDENFALLNSVKDEKKRKEKIYQRTRSFTCLPIKKQLEDVLEREENDDEVDDFSSLEGDTTPKLWSTNDLVAPPIFSVNNDTIDSYPKPISFQQSIKNIFSSLFNWRNTSKSLPRKLPKGSREYYAARESLGDEMSTFRKQTMPRLIACATSKGKLDRSRGETLRKKEFSNFIGRWKSLDDEVDTLAAKPSLATIRPVYGTLKSAKRISRAQEIKPLDSVYGSMKVQLPEVPVRQSSLPTERQLSYLPSKPRDQPKHVSPMVYDVPRSSRRFAVHREPIFSPPNNMYENFKHVNYDKRIYDNTMLTKF